MIASVPARPIDLGCVNGHYFFNVASIGFSADLAGELTADLKRRLGTVGYAVAAFRLCAGRGRSRSISSMTARWRP